MYAGAGCVQTYLVVCHLEKLAGKSFTAVQCITHGSYVPGTENPSGEGTRVARRHWMGSS